MKDFTCAKCDKTMFPTFVLNDRTGKLVAQCANQECLFTDNSLTPADFNTGLAAAPGDGASGEGWAGKKQVVVDTSPQPLAIAQPIAAPQAAVNGPPAFVPPAQHAPGDVLAWIEQRSIWLGAEEARLAGEKAGLDARIAAVKAERKQLDKMLRAGLREQARTAEVRLMPLPNPSNLRN